MAYFLDLQGFQIGINNDFVVKELSFIDSVGNHFEHYIFKPVFEFNLLCNADKKKVCWLTKNYHQLAWNSGFVNYSELPNILEKVCSQNTIYVKGLQKIAWIKKWVPNAHVVNIEHFDYPNLETLINKYKNSLKHCNLHHKNCSTTNVGILLSYFMDEKIKLL